MFGVIRRVVAPDTTEWVYVKGELRMVLPPGVHWIIKPFRRMTFEARLIRTRNEADHYVEVDGGNFVFVYRNESLATVMELPLTVH